jgi:hypothetical protein
MRHEPAGERIAGARRIEHLLQRIGGRLENGIGIDEERAVIALLEAGPLDVATILAAFPQARARRIQLSLLWMSKIGVLSWG